MAGVKALRLSASCFMRAGPTPAAAPLGLGKRGMTCPSAGPAENGWHPVAFRGGVAWVAERFVEVEIQSEP